MDKPSLLSPPGSVVVSSAKQAHLSMQQLQQRAADIPAMVSQYSNPHFSIRYAHSEQHGGRLQQGESMAHLDPPPRQVSPLRRCTFSYPPPPPPPPPTPVPPRRPTLLWVSAPCHSS